MTEQKKSSKKDVLEYIKAIAEAITAVAPIVKYVLVAAGTFLVVTFMTPNGPTAMEEYSAKITALETENKAVVAQSEQRQVTIDSLARVATVHRGEAASAKRRLAVLEANRPSDAIRDSLEQNVDSLIQAASDSSAIIVAQGELIITQKETIAADSAIKVELRTENTSLKSENSALVLENGLLRTDNIDLRLQLAKPIPQPPEEKFLWFFDQPTRKQAFVAGVIGGIVITALVVK